MCRSREVEGNFTHKEITVTVVIVEAWNLCSYMERDEEMATLSEWFNFWKIVLELKTGNVVISGAGARTDVVLSKAIKHVTLGN
jgi:hypothetical protein